MAKITINERSWAIDLISEINQYLAGKKRRINHAGGENTLKNNSKSLFPDLLLFGDPSKSDIIQGWELKMPDTTIDDVEFIGNATKKAMLLKLDSFLLWNVSTAILYKKVGVTYTPYKVWDTLTNIKTRGDVSSRADEWKALMRIIVDDLNEYFENGSLGTRKLIDNLSIDAFIDVILENTAPTAENIHAAISKNRTLGAEINLWWLSSRSEYNDSANEYQVLARLILTDWLIKFVFAHIIKLNFSAAREVEAIDFDMTVDEGIATFHNISNTCDFWNIFSSQLGSNAISAKAWDELIQINQFLKNINIHSIDIRLLHTLLQNSILITRRKVAGQYCTPQKLAELLVKITVEDATGGVLDPCCGTGTIINEAYKLKESFKISTQDITNNIWASDKFSYPLQLATLSLTKPDNYGQVLNIFRQDVTKLKVGQKINFINPKNGNTVVKTLPTVKYVVSNLPFVQQEDLDELNPDVGDINQWIIEQTKSSTTVDGRSDLYGYIPFYLHRILDEDGKIGIIVSNAWLGTDYGKSFIKLLKTFFFIESIVVSGKGKWFSNANVVTAIIVLKKRNSTAQLPSKFCVLKHSIDDIKDINFIADSILLGKSNENLSIVNYSAEQIDALEKINVPWSAFFADIFWLHSIQGKLLPVKQIFDIGRGERRGWNAMFYPEDNNDIESDYIKPVLKNLRNCKGLVAEPNKVAFCCGIDIHQLKRLGHTGALNWIKKFEYQNNNTGIPLTTSLARSNHYWYEMKTDTLADFVANINYDESLFIAKLSNRSFVDQRLIPLLIREEYKNENPLFLFALLNCSLTMFYIEALGFGRGLGALDLNATKFANGLMLLNPNGVNQKSKDRIVEAFHSLLKRNRYSLKDELHSEDRIHFEKILYFEYGIEAYYPLVQQALYRLFNLRFAVKN